MQHVFSFTLAEAWAFLIYAAGAAAGLYAGGRCHQQSHHRNKSRPGQPHYQVGSAGERHGTVEH